MLTAEQYTKMIAYLRSPVGSRVRTNNHVERMNRVLRLYEKSRYKWRQARSKVRFVWLLVERRWGQKVRVWKEGYGANGGQGAQVVLNHDPKGVSPPQCHGRKVA